MVRLAQVNMELARIEADFSGLSRGKHGWSINEFGDLTKGPSSTGKVFNPANKATNKEVSYKYTLSVSPSPSQAQPINNGKEKNFAVNL